MNIPGNPYYSCGSSRYWATDQAAHANPVNGASQYQFRFHIPAENFEVIRTTSSYLARLGWTDATPLAIGSRYEVDVRVLMNGEWCPWGDVCAFTICAPGTVPCATGTPAMLAATDQEHNATLELWPDPNRGDLVNIAFLIDGGSDDMHATIEIFDMYGSRVMHRQLLLQDGRIVNTVRELQGYLAAGMYMVNMTAGGKTITKRLMVQPCSQLQTEKKRPFRVSRGGLFSWVMPGCRYMAASEGRWKCRSEIKVLERTPFLHSVFMDGS